MPGALMPRARMLGTRMLGALMLGALSLAGCANSALRRGQSDLAALQRQLPGVYTSTSADTADTGKAAAGTATEGAAGSSAVTLSIEPITAQVIGDAVYFVRETPADNSRLVLAEGIWTLSLGAASDRGRDNSGRGPGASGRGHDASDRGPTIVQHRFLFKDPRRWVGAADNPDLLLAILPEDLQALSGCDLIWHKTLTGFETGSAPLPCHPGSGAQGLWIEQHARLQGMQLSLTERQTDSEGGLDNSGAPLSLQLTRTAGAQ